jgi:hypothetical protein
MNRKSLLAVLVSAALTGAAATAYAQEEPAPQPQPEQPGGLTPELVVQADEIFPAPSGDPGAPDLIVVSQSDEQPGPQQPEQPGGLTPELAA